MLDVIKNTQQLLIVRERAWYSTRKSWTLLIFPMSLIPLFYGLSYASELNWLALFFIVNGAIQILIFGA